VDDLTFEDLVSVQPKIDEVEFLGKRAWIRALSFDAQIALSEMFAGKEDQEAGLADMKYMVAHTLCDSAGKLLFDDAENGVKVLGNVGGKELLSLFKHIQTANGMDIDEEAKN